MADPIQTNAGAARSTSEEGADWPPDPHDVPTAEGRAEQLAADIGAVEAATAGDRRAFARLYRGFGPMVHGILLARVEPHEVSDLLQDVFVVALRRLPELREPAAFGGWLARIARNRAVDHHRRRRLIEELHEDNWVSEPPPTAEALAVLRTIRELPEAYRETMVLRLVEGMTGPEISLRTGLTAGSVRVNLHRGMKLLRARLQGGRDDV